MKMQKRNHEHKRKIDFSIIKAILIGIIIFAVFSLFFRLVNVNGNSMNDTYSDGDKVMIFKHGTPEKGDIIVCNCEEINGYIIKRIIAVGGDEIDIDFETGTVTLNGEVLTENYIKEPTYTDEGGFEYPVTVPEGYLFVMVDNRNNSTDSRDARIGFVSVDDVIGKVLFKLPSF